MPPSPLSSVSVKRHAGIVVTKPVVLKEFTSQLQDLSIQTQTSPSLSLAAGHKEPTATVSAPPRARKSLNLGTETSK